MNIKINTQFNADIIKQSIECGQELQCLHSGMAEDILILKEQGVIDALIALGWTPPKNLKLPIKGKE